MTSPAQRAILKAQEKCKKCGESEWLQRKGGRVCRPCKRRRERETYRRKRDAG